jgi:hypothetical protein
MRTLAALLLASILTLAARAAEPWLKPGDVVALVGGEDMVALAEEGWLETLVTWAQPGDRIRFRSLAWEGDTVFEQRRDLNYPTLETQLDKMGATVVICQFGKMESFAGKEGVAAFTEAYEKLLARLSGEKKRRIALVMPMRFGEPENEPSHMPKLMFQNSDLAAYVAAIRALAQRHNDLTIEPDWKRDEDSEPYHTRDGVHLPTSTAINDTVDDVGDFKARPHTTSWWVAVLLAKELGLFPNDEPSQILMTSDALRARAAVRAKNRLWFHYTRPQNWAFLAGNRTNQPSSRDHLDPTRRWFPEEMEQWVPLIEAKEKEIWALAAAPR